MAELDVGVLGALVLSVDGVGLRVPRGRPRVVLAALALAAPQAVTPERLADAVWGDRLPERPRAGVQTLVSRLRTVVGHAFVESASGGYRLAAATVDVHEFRRLLTAARAAEDTDVEVALLGEALSLWRGEPLTDVPSEALCGHRPRLVEERLGAVERYADLVLAAGQHDSLVPTLRDLTESYPLRETLWHRLILATYRAGRQTEALDLYRRLRDRLAEELGVDPDDRLKHLYQAILTRCPSLDVPAQPVPVPRQLPADLRRFTGRRAALGRLDALLAEHRRNATAGAPPVTVAALTGIGGVGKTTLAVHWAHRVAAEFPDGQLYADLGGYGPGDPVAPEAVADSFLRNLGVPAAAIPSRLDARTAMLRTALADRRVLVVLDNARAADQVLPLLPGTAAFVVVTSRDRLRPLVARGTAEALELHQLPLGEATDLLTDATHQADVPTAAPPALAELAALAGRLPLALALVADQVDRRGDATTVLAELRDRRARLDVLDAGEPRVDLRAVFSCSYETLDPACARMFRLLAVHPGRDVSLPAAAAVADLPQNAARPLLERLVDAHQLNVTAPDRWAQHDLVHVFADELTTRLDSADERHHAVVRVLDWYAGTADHARAAIWRTHRPAPVPSDATVPPRTFATKAAALQWLDAERSNLVAAMRHAADHELPRTAARLADSLFGYVTTRSVPDGWVAATEATLRSAERAADDGSAATALLVLAVAQISCGDSRAALDTARSARRRYEFAGDRHGMVNAQLVLARAHAGTGGVVQASTVLEDALRACRALRHHGIEALILDQLAELTMRSGRPRDAVRLTQDAIRVDDEHDGRGNRPYLEATLGRAYLGTGDRALAEEHLTRAASSLHHFGDRRTAEKLAGMITT